MRYRIYKIAAGVSAAVAGLLSAGFARATELFALPEGFAASATAYIGDTIEATWELLVIAIGVPLAFYVIGRVIGLIPKGRKA